MTRRTAVVATALLACLLTGCTDDPVAVRAPESAPASAAPAPAETRAVDAAGDQLTMTMTPLVRTGGTVVLTVATRLDRAASGGNSAVTRHFSSILATSFDNVRLVDPVARRVYLVADGADGRGCTCTGLKAFGPGETLPLQAAFTGIPPAVSRLSVMLPYAGVFFDVPVTDGVAPQPLDLTDAGESYAADLDAYTERLGLGVSTRRTPQKLEIDLAADVLFRVDSAQLTPTAAKSVAAAVADLRRGTPGPLTVTGHTDDTGTAEHNRTLSEQRAQTVAADLAKVLPAAQWPMTVAGRGETEPEVRGTSADDRRRNRRVTISYEGTAPAAEPSESPDEPPAELPKATGVTGTAAEGIEAEMSLGRGTIRFRPGTATVHGAFLQVDLVATNTGEKNATILDYLGQGVFTVRDEFDPYARYGASGVRLLDGATATYGLDYVVASGDHRCLCDRLLSPPIPPGSAQTIALWFPAPPPGTKTVTLDVPDQFRITDVPVA